MTSYTRRHLEDRQVRRRWTDPRLSKICLDEIRQYLIRKGWKEVPPDREGWLVFEEPGTEDGPLYQWLPDSEHRREFSQAIYEFLAAVAEIENRSAVEVLTEVLASGRPESGTAAQSV